MKPLCLYLEVSHHLIQEELMVGMIVGLIIRVSPGMMIQNMVSFKYSVFFNFLLPPIILNSGYELHQVYRYMCIIDMRPISSETSGVFLHLPLQEHSSPQSSLGNFPGVSILIEDYWYGY